LVSGNEVFQHFIVDGRKFVPLRLPRGSNSSMTCEKQIKQHDQEAADLTFHVKPKATALLELI